MKDRALKKIGIMSLYYQNPNMGGLLQAYALTHMISKLGGDVEQISFDFRRYYNSGLSRKFNRIKMALLANHSNQKFKNRLAAYTGFMNQIPHSKYCGDLSSSANKYTSIVVGSDQVWGEWLPLEALKQYLLCVDGFTGNKYSYAASIGADTISDDNKDLYLSALSKFKTVSVRERGACDLLQSIGVNANVNVDPTLLLSTTEWDKISKHVNKPDKYIFCYFLGAEKSHREAATNIAKKLNLPIVTIPYARHHKDAGYEDGFGDCLDYETGPDGFIDLIKNAELVITDSFHAIVFASKYHVNFYVLSRVIEGDSSSNGRIVDYLTMIDKKDRYVTSEQLLALENNLGIDYSNFDEIINAHIEKGIKYLETIVGESR